MILTVIIFVLALTGLKNVRRDIYIYSDDF